jgi:hypothetical protein
MPFTSVLGASSVIKPGVCTSSTRPTAPYVGQLVFETDTNRLVVFTASGWVYQTALGAFDTATVATSQSTSSTSFTDLATVGPSVTLTTGTKVLVIVNCWFDSLTTNEHQYADFAISGATTRSASYTTSLTARSYGTGAGISRLRASAANLVTCTAGSNTFTMKYATGGASCDFFYRTIIVVSLGS